MIVVGPFPKGAPLESPGGKNLDLYELYWETAKATERWGEDLMNESEMRSGFFSRYEDIISENRMTKFYFDGT